MMEQSEQVHSETQGTGVGDCLPIPRSSWLRKRSVRQSLELVPSRDFNPSPEEILRHAILLGSSGERVRIILRSHAPGQMAYLLESTPDALTTIRSRVPEGLSVRDPEPTPVLSLHSLSRCLVHFPSPAREVPANPDPLADFAHAFATLAEDEFAEVTVDLLPAQRAPRETLGVSRGALRTRVSHHATGAVTTLVYEGLSILTHPVTAPAPRASPVSPTTTREATKVLADPVYSFHIQCLVSAWASDAGRARDLARDLAGPFGHWVPARGNLRVSFRSPSLEHRAEGKWPGVSRSPVVPVVSIAGLLLPPTASCAAPNVRRTAASAPVPSRLLPLGPWVWPLGYVEGHTEPVGIPSRPVLFGISTGRPEFGKTSAAMTEFTAMTAPWPEAPGHVPDGGLFLDPHRDAVGDLLPFYHSCPERVLLIDLGASWEGMRLPIYNPADAHGTTLQEGKRRVSAIVGGLSSAAGWDRKATRSLPLAQQAAGLVVAMSRLLPPEAPVPTIFQISTVLTNDRWRHDLLEGPVPQPMKDWWRNEFEDGTGKLRYPKDAILPVTQLISRLRASTPMAAFLGGRSTFTFREAMDTHMVVLFGGLLSGDDQEDRLATSLLMRSLIQAAYSRGDVPREIRHFHCPPFWIFGDEAPTWDGADLPKVFIELRKFLIRCKVMAVTPAALSRATWDAAVTAASLISTTAIDGPGAAMVAGTWRGPGAADLVEIERYHHLISVLLDQTGRGEQRTGAFAVKGMQPQDIFEARPGVVEAHIVTDPRYRDAAEVVAELDTLDDRLMEAWGGDTGGAVAVHRT